MRTFNPNLYPDGGYVFTDRDGTRIRGESWKDLESRVRGYRAVNGFEAGDPWAEIQNQICANQGGLCREEGPPPAPPTAAAHSMTFNQRVIQWVAEIVQKKRVNALPRVDDRTAAARARICAKCPKQKGLNRVCQSCILSISQAEKAVLGGKSLHRNLSPCSVLGQDCAIAVHVEQPRSNNPELPANCWRR